MWRNLSKWLAHGSASSAVSPALARRGLRPGIRKRRQHRGRKCEVASAYQAEMACASIYSIGSKRSAAGSKRHVAALLNRGTPSIAAHEKRRTQPYLYRPACRRRNILHRAPAIVAAWQAWRYSPEKPILLSCPRPGLSAFARALRSSGGAWWRATADAPIGIGEA